VNPHDPTTWKQVVGWVGGPKKDSMRLREDSGWYAHDKCVKKLVEGQAIDQPTLEDSVADVVDEAIKSGTVNTDDLPEELRP
jgi:hypothetical protein